MPNQNNTTINAVACTQHLYDDSFTSILIAKSSREVVDKYLQMEKEKR